MPMPAPQPARGTVGRYHLLERLAAGGMGEVWLAAARGAAGFEKHVAIKRILPHLAADEDFVRRFIDEARIVVTLNHGNVVQVLDMGEEDGEYYIAMEYLSGRDLRAVLRRCTERGEPLGPDLALYVTTEVCRGLGYAHRKADDQGRELRIVHRDVSPSNVLLSWEGEVKVTDFGVASALGRLTDSLAGRLHGKISYMSPEQAAGEALDRRSDLYSAGIVCWEMLTGRRLFDGASDTEVLRKVQEGDVVPPSSVVPGLPPAVDGVVLRALARHRGDRYAGMEDFAEAAQRLLYAEPTGPVIAPTLAARLRELFPDETASASLPSLDDALRHALADLGDGGPPERETASARRPEGLPGLATSAAEPRPAATPPRPVARWLSALALAGLALGYLAAMPSELAWGRLEVESDPPDAEVRLGGVPVGRTPWSGDWLPAGEPVRLELARDGYGAWHTTVQVAARAVQRAHAVLTLRPDAPRPDAAAEPAAPAAATFEWPPWRRSLDSHVRASDRPLPARPRPARVARRAQEPEETGVLFVRAKPTGRVRVGDRWYPSPLTGLELPAGRHVVTVEHQEWGVSQRQEVRIRPGEDTRVVVELARPPAGQGAP